MLPSIPDKPHSGSDVEALCLFFFVQCGFRRLGPSARASVCESPGMGIDHRAGVGGGVPHVRHGNLEECLGPSVLHGVFFLLRIARFRTREHRK